MGPLWVQAGVGVAGMGWAHVYISFTRLQAPSSPPALSACPTCSPTNGAASSWFV